jgi:hypothetical protein
VIDSQTSGSPTTMAHQSCIDLGQTLRQEVTHGLLLLPSLYATWRHTASPRYRPLGGTTRGRAPPSTPALTGTGMPAPSTRIEGTTISEQAPSLPHTTDKTRPPSGDDKYNRPPSKYGLTGRAYDPTHYGMGLMTTVLTFKANQANEGHDPKTQDRGHRFHDQLDNR